MSNDLYLDPDEWVQTLSDIEIDELRLLPAIPAVRHALDVEWSWRKLVALNLPPKRSTHPTPTR